MPTSLRTYRFKIKNPNPSKVEALKSLAALYSKGLNYCLESAKQTRPKHAFDLHKPVYGFLRKIGLPSQIALSCRDRAYEAYKSHLARKTYPVWHKFPHFDNLPAVRLNFPRSVSFYREKDSNQFWISVSTHIKRINLRITGKQKAVEKVINSKPTHGEIVFRNNGIYFHVAIPVPARVPGAKECKTFIGVDLNVSGHLLVAAARDIAKGETRDVFLVSAGRFNWKRKHFNEVRRSLQKKKKLRKVTELKARERNYVKNFLHVATARFMEWAKEFPSPFIALEDLKGIRSKVSHSRRLNHKIHSWPFRDGQDMITYKGSAEGMFVKTLSGAFSSRYCSRCQSRNTRRSGARFRCLDCGYELNAHLNGAGNMSWRALRYTLAAAGRAERQDRRASIRP